MISTVHTGTTQCYAAAAACSAPCASTPMVDTCTTHQVTAYPQGSPQSTSQPTHQVTAYRQGSPQSPSQPYHRYSDGAVISEESMASATESHLAKQQFPVSATATLRHWLRHNITSPYADHKTKSQLAERTGLSTDQIAAWLTNARRRLIPKVIPIENHRRRMHGLPSLPPVQLREKYPLGKPPGSREDADPGVTL
eukprot:scpid98782/ scgid4080/ Homeobox protein unc-62; Uncoordinated protein 62